MYFRCTDCATGKPKSAAFNAALRLVGARTVWSVARWLLQNHTFLVPWVDNHRTPPPPPPASSEVAEQAAHLSQFFLNPPSSPRTQCVGTQPPPPSGGSPLQQANAYVPPETPTGTFVQPLPPPPPLPLFPYAPAAVIQPPLLSQHSTLWRTERVALYEHRAFRDGLGQGGVRGSDFPFSKNSRRRNRPNHRPSPFNRRRPPSDRGQSSCNQRRYPATYPSKGRVLARGQSFLY